ncbi:hypothetical protein R1Y80_09415 [Streptomyces sp. JL1001]|uniref:Uncharacterized protein n=1 Tax=Streptomyces sp. JL1001 TaxID=3078227 RepID=A0AAU8KFY4_9ACTN
MRDLIPGPVPLHPLGELPGGERRGEQGEEPGQPLLVVVQQLPYAPARIGEGVLVGGQHLGHPESADPLQRGEVVAERIGDGGVVRVLVQPDVRTDPRQQVVAGEQPPVPFQPGGMPLLQMEADMARGVPGRPDGTQPPPGEVEQLAGDDLPVRQGGAQPGQGPQPPPAAGGAQRGEVVVRRADGGELAGEVVEPGAGLGFPGTADDRGVGLVHGDPGPGRLADLAGESVVVGVVVGDDDAVDVGDGGTEGGEPGDQGLPGGGIVPAGVDEDGPPVGVDEVDQGVPEGIVRDGHPDAVDAPAVIGHLRPGPVSHLCHGLPFSARVSTVTRTRSSGSPGLPNRGSAGVIDAAAPVDY